MLLLHHHQRPGQQGVRRYFVADDNFARNRDWQPIFDRLIALRERDGINIRLIIQVDALCHEIPDCNRSAKRPDPAAERPGFEPSRRSGKCRGFLVTIDAGKAPRRQSDFVGGSVISTQTSPLGGRTGATVGLLAVERGAIAVVAVMTLLRLAVSGSVLLTADEAYYWQWTRPLHLSYLEHPPMVAWWIAAGIRLFGDTVLGVRSPALLGVIATSALVWDTARLAFGSRPAGAFAALWLNCALLFNAAGLIMTPDSPLLLFWSLALWAAARLCTGGGAGWLYVLGLALGLGAISKYTMALILPGLLVTLLCFAEPRRRLRSAHLYGAVLLALLCTAPVVVWNLQHGMAGWRQQAGHAFASPVASPLGNLAAFVLGQIGLLTPLLFAACLWPMIWAMVAGWRQARPLWFLMGATSLPVLLFFAQHSLAGVVQAHWAGPAYLGAAIATAGWLGQTRRPRWLTVGAPALGVALSLLVFFQAATAALPIPPRVDPLKRLGGWDELAAAVAEQRRSHPDAFLFTEKREETGIVSFYLADHAPVFLFGTPVLPPYYTAAEVAALRGRDGILVRRAKDTPSADLVRRFARITPLRQVQVHWGGQPTFVYDLSLAEGYDGGAAAADATR